ncbi:hypothetical protein [uncultured Parolsenella sp.]|uniref:hypothetical protein n=1 Tax=uncultured Parolsenella sp. TaxID=2083008 RepID=UPI0025D1D30E|nr:hypothetical protein [uncultured Parolsenella sp.]
MLFALVLKPEELTYTYGDIPNVPSSTNDAAEVVSFDLPGGLSIDDFYEQFVEPIDARCGALLDYGDVDYLDGDACASLAAWIPARCADEGLFPWVRGLYGKLLEYAKRAVELDTGVVVEL